MKRLRIVKVLAPEEFIQAVQVCLARNGHDASLQDIQDAFSRLPQLEAPNEDAVGFLAHIMASLDLDAVRSPKLVPVLLRKAVRIYDQRLMEAIVGHKDMTEAVAWKVVMDELGKTVERLEEALPQPYKPW